MQKDAKEQWNGYIMKKNRLIEICRFLFCIIILMVHTHGLRPVSSVNYPFSGGYIVVEFFLILSGFFTSNYAMTKVTNSTPAESAISYVWRQYIKIFPITTICIIMQYIVTAYFNKLKFQDFPYIMYEILLLPQAGIYKTFLNLPLWYLSAYFICLPILIFLLNKYRDFFYNIGAIIAPIIIYGFICRTNIDLDIWSFNSHIWYIGLFRTFAGLCVGVCSYRIFCGIKNIHFTKSGQVAIKTTAIISMICVIGYIYLFSFTYADYFLVFMMMFLLAYINTIDIKSTKWDNLWYFLGELSIYIYCSHWTIRSVVPRLMTNNTYEEMLPIYLISAIIYAFLIKIVVSKFKKIIKLIWRNFIYDSTI